MTDRDKLTRRSVLSATAVSIVGLAGCTDGGGGGSGGSGTTGTATDKMTDGMTTTENMTEGSMTTSEESMETTTSASMSTLQYEVSNLPSLPMGHYEGWAIFGSEKVSTGTFGAGDSPTFETDRDLMAADKIVVTVEPDDDPSAKPSGVVALAGALKDGTADLSFPVDFSMVAGSYILATPTNGGDSNETAGVWFLDPSGPEKSLTLPDLPKGWVYEGWAVSDGTPLTTGRFESPSGTDGFAGFSGMQDGPPFPGEDFLTNSPDGVSFPLDLANGKSAIAITVEPDLDGMDPNGPAPSGIKPLAAKVPADATDHTSYDLKPVTAGIPTGMATVER